MLLVPAIGSAIAPGATGTAFAGETAVAPTRSNAPASPNIKRFISNLLYRRNGQPDRSSPLAHPDNALRRRWFDGVWLKNHSSRTLFVIRSAWFSPI
jgi:hypothetical protein